uniref:Uncharacterized protein n=1 Tax=Opuntia streptacantha TaxID=393608 RepID=A0A7C9AW32_OPUST
MAFWDRLSIPFLLFLTCSQLTLVHIYLQEYGFPGFSAIFSPSSTNSPFSTRFKKLALRILDAKDLSTQSLEYGCLKRHSWKPTGPSSIACKEQESMCKSTDNADL